ncbi:MAG: RodZ domain-containing protein [Burkholderiaceae bacterium]
MSSVVSEPAPPGVAAAVARSAGAFLRDARQQRGLHIGALASMLKVPQSKLEALEADRWQDLPDMTFARALAKSMCRVLKTDAAPVLALLPRGDERELDVSAGLNQPYRERGAHSEGLSLSWLRRPVVWAPIVLLLAAALVYTMPANWISLPPGVAELHATGDAAPAGQSVPAPAPATATVTAPTTIATPAPESTASGASFASAGPNEPPAMPPTGSEVLPVPARGATATAAVTAAANPVTAATTAPAPAAVPAVVAPAGLVPLGLRASADSWVEIVDARGQTLISKLLRSGEAQELAGKPPLKVTVGNVSGTHLSLRGATVDLAAQSHDNVARIELN